MVIGFSGAVTSTRGVQAAFDARIPPAINRLVNTRAAPLDMERFLTITAV
jgi:hypothetical protein